MCQSRRYSTAAECWRAACRVPAPHRAVAWCTHSALQQISGCPASWHFPASGMGRKFCVRDNHQQQSRLWLSAGQSCSRQLWMKKKVEGPEQSTAPAKQKEQSPRKRQRALKTSETAIKAYQNRRNSQNCHSQELPECHSSRNCRKWMVVANVLAAL